MEIEFSIFLFAFFTVLFYCITYCFIYFRNKYVQQKNEVNFKKEYKRRIKQIEVMNEKLAERETDNAESVNDIAKDYFNEGQAKFNWDRNYKGAIEDFNKAIEVEPNNSNYYYNRALAKEKLQDYKEAIEDFNMAIELNPNDNYYGHRAEVKEKLQDYEGAVKDYTEAINFRSCGKSVYVAKKEKAEKNLKYKNKIFDVYDSNQIRILRENIKIAKRPYNPELYIARGNLRAYNFEDYNGAMEDFNKAISLKSDYVEAYVLKGDLEKKLNDYESAIEDYNKAISLKSDCIEAYIGLSKIETALKNPQKAKIYIEEALVINSQAVNEYLDKIKYEKIEKQQEAWDVREKWQKSDGLRNYYIKNIQKYTNDIYHKPDDEKAYYNRGYGEYCLALYIEDNKPMGISQYYKSAIEDLNKAIELNPEYIEPYLIIGDIKTVMKEYDEADKYYDKVLEIDSDELYAYMHKIDLYKKTGKENELNEIYKKLEEIYKSYASPEVINQIGRIVDF